MEVTARNQNGVELGRHEARDLDDARAWIVRNSAPAFVDGFTGIPWHRIDRAISDLNDKGYHVDLLPEVASA